MMRQLAFAAMLLGFSAINGMMLPDIFNRDVHFDGKVYKFALDHKGTYNEAADFCRITGGILATPKTKKINDILAARLSAGIPSRAWIGLNDMKEETVFQWEDGSNLDFKNGFHRFDDPKVGPHKPKRIARLFEDCVALDSTGTWHDYRCKTGLEKHHFICEYPGTS